MVIIKGRISLKEDEPPKLLCESVEPLEKINSSKIYLRAENEIEAKQINLKLKEIIREEQKGDTPIYLVAMKERQKFRVQRDRWVSLESDIVEVLKEILGEENIKVEDN